VARPQHLKGLLEPTLVLQEVSVRGQAEAKPGDLLRRRHLLCNTIEVRGLGKIRRQRAQVTPDSVELPRERLVGLGGSVTREHAADEAAYDVGPECEAS